LAHPSPLARMGPAGRLGLGLGLVATLALVGEARGQIGGPLFFGSAPEPRPKAPLDEGIPRGRPVLPRAPRPPDASQPACSLRRPVCVAPSPEVPAATTLEWLEHLELAWERTVWALGAPAPLTDFAKGGSPSLDLYLSSGSEELRAVVDRPSAWHRDSSSTHCVVGPNHPDPERAATLCVGEAIANRLDPAEPDPARRALAEHLWLAVGQPTDADADAIDDAQAHPERPLLGTTGSSSGMLVLYEHLDSVGAGVPTGIALSLHALAAGPASPPDLRFDNEPDVFDVLRASAGPKATDLGRFASTFALSRALLGRGRPDRNFGINPLAAEARVRFDWRIPLSSLPRHLAMGRPIGPFGATYTWVDLDRPTKDLTLAVVATWEQPVSFAWTLATLDGSGHLLRRFDVPYVERATRAERTLVDFEGAEALVIAGLNLGDHGPSYPYDPDFAPHESHAAALYIVEVPPQPSDR
jgi:hypothetical protein